MGSSELQQVLFIANLLKKFFRQSHCQSQFTSSTKLLFIGNKDVQGALKKYAEFSRDKSASKKKRILAC